MMLRSPHSVTLKGLHGRIRLRLRISRAISSSVGDRNDNSSRSSSSNSSNSTGDNRAVTKSMASRLYPAHLSLMMFGSSTDVGKTIISAGLCIAALNQQRKTLYLKPLQTGDIDEYFIQSYTNPQGNNDIFIRTLHQWRKSSPVSAAAATSAATTATSINAAAANAAARKSNGSIIAVTDRELVSDVYREIRAFENSNQSDGRSGPQEQLFTVVETAGGVLSPGPVRTLQADVYRPLRLPSILVGDARMGGVSTTLAAYEALRSRGYAVHAIVLIEQQPLQKAPPLLLNNALFIEEQLSVSHGAAELDEIAVQKPPLVLTFSPLPSDRSLMLYGWFKENEAQFADLLQHSISCLEQSLLSDRQLNDLGSVCLPISLAPDAAATSSNTSSGAGGGGNGGVLFVESAHQDLLRVLQLDEDRTAYANASSYYGNSLMSEGRGSHPNDVSSRLGLSSSSSSSGGGGSTINNLDYVNLFDGSASGFSQSVGHGSASMALSIAAAASRYGHLDSLRYPLLQPFPSSSSSSSNNNNSGNNSSNVSGPMLQHAPGVLLAARLCRLVGDARTGPGSGWARRCFFFDTEHDALLACAVPTAIRLTRHRRSVKGSKASSDDSAAIAVDATAEASASTTTATKTADGRKFTVLVQNSNATAATASLFAMTTATTNDIAVPTVSYRRGQLLVDCSALRCEEIDSLWLLQQQQLLDAAVTAAVTSPAPAVITRVKVPAAAAVAAGVDKEGRGATAATGITATTAAAAATIVVDSIDALFDFEARFAEEISHSASLANAYRSFIIERLEEISEHYEIGALLLEPLLLAADVAAAQEIRFADPLYQKLLVQECRRRGIAVIFNEVASGLWRLGYPSSGRDALGEAPDVMCLGRSITSGYLPLAATLLTEEAFTATTATTSVTVNSSSNAVATSVDALVEGEGEVKLPMVCWSRGGGNPIACAAGLEALRLIEQQLLQQQQQQQQQSAAHVGGFFRSGTALDVELSDISCLPGVSSTMAIGGVLAVELLPTSNAEATTAAVAGRYSKAALVAALMRQQRISASSAGAHTVLLTASLFATDADKQRLLRVLKRCITRAFYSKQ